MSASPRNSSNLSAAAIRGMCRSGELTGPTSGLADDHVQANLMIVPREYAFDFLLFCQRNPKPCPLVEVLEPGQFMPSCAPGADIRTDLPGYRVYRDGVLTQEPTDILDLWQNDFVSFLIGCSFSFESALTDGGIRLRHIEQQRNVAMYKTNMPCQPAGRFQGNAVVSMRPIKSRDVARAVEITARLPQVHGAPVHIGHPQVIGIEDLALPDFGDAVEILDDELPVFWACGVTPQYIAEMSRIPLCITHAPGRMFVSDKRN
ncbi:putative hydro-lyase [Herbaspirillum sp. RTI4]|uniref:putative hydro-lyase n=1 Tax=Herbaspirillum sp. RTI4 TaxID=3048640 RepID=UPI002AB4881F|nr:putative hydro-lyase [Herbaspirillum sp. RTI4]MDY7578018.1 putative hydro-lyase [Herbaspirillum sp. RTI4]MEA9982052.1 putative hydro-lyase [Herbaspirillum sp. RTI4]